MTLARRIATAGALGAAVALLLPVALSAHAVVYPRAAAPGAYERYLLRVPNERDVATTRVEIRFPAEVRVTSFADVPGWPVQVVTDSAKRIIGAIWTGSLPPQRFVELPFVAVNPKSGVAAVSWPTYQTYADGQRVEWTGAAGSRTPVSVTTIAAAGAGGGASVTWAALALGLVSLGITLRPHRDASETTRRPYP
jgi:uncharacterized protein YcnI